MRSRTGWVFIDVMMATILLSIIAGILGFAANWHQHALKHLSDARAASRLAESALLSLQSGQSPPATGVAFHRLSSSTDLPGRSWVQVDATVGARRAGVVGLVPDNSIPGGGS
jgi:ABC-type Fe3+ transport system permease subunit